MAKKRYHVTGHSQYSVTIQENGPHLFPKVVTLQRAAITSITSKLSGLYVATSAGQVYHLDHGIRAEQRALTSEAFGL